MSRTLTKRIIVDGAMSGVPAYVDFWYNRGQCCFWCYKPLNYNSISLDHFYPISKGGRDNVHNMVWSCDDCNQEKSDSCPLEYGITKILEQKYARRIIPAAIAMRRIFCKEKLKTVRIIKVGNQYITRIGNKSYSFTLKNQHVNWKITIKDIATNEIVKYNILNDLAVFIMSNAKRKK